MRPLPAGFRLLPDGSVRRYDGDRVLVGGSPRRVLRLSDRGASIAGRLLDGAAVRSDPEATLARRLVDAGLAHPVPPDAPVPFEVVVPSYDDTAALRHCLAVLGRDVPVTVVDDGSADPVAVRDTASSHGARVLRLDRNRGPGAARNAGTAAATTSVVAFVDSDAVVSAVTLQRLAAHFTDPAVAAVAPRVRPVPGTSAGVLARFAEAASPLDLGPRSSLVAPNRKVGYVPSTVLLVRRSALDDVGGFDEGLRYGEDVDLVWRLTAAGHVVRYDAASSVHHREPASWQGWLARRFRYGTSTGPLARRHEARAVSLTMRPAPLVTVALVVAGRPVPATAVAGGTAARIARRLNQAGVPSAPTATAAAVAPLHTALAASRWLTQLWWPALAAAAIAAPRRRAAVAAVVTAPPLVTWASRRPRLDPFRWLLASWADDAAYGAGVWTGCARSRAIGPLLPRLARGDGGFTGAKSS